MVRFSVCTSVAGYTVSSVVVGDWRRLYVAGAPRFKHKGKVILFDLTPEGDVIITQALNGEQVAISPSLLYLFTLTCSPFTHTVSGTAQISIKPLREVQFFEFCNILLFSVDLLLLFLSLSFFYTTFLLSHN